MDCGDLKQTWQHIHMLTVQHWGRNSHFKKGYFESTFSDTTWFTRFNVKQKGCLNYGQAWDSHKSHLKDMSATIGGNPLIKFADVATSSFAQIPCFIAVYIFGSVFCWANFCHTHHPQSGIYSFSDCKMLGTAKSLTEPLRNQTRSEPSNGPGDLREGKSCHFGKLPLRHHQGKPLFFVNRLVLLKEEKTCFLERK